MHGRPLGQAVPRAVHLPLGPRSAEGAVAAGGGRDSHQGPRAARKRMGRDREASARPVTEQHVRRTNHCGACAVPSRCSAT